MRDHFYWTKWFEVLSLLQTRFEGDVPILKRRIASMSVCPCILNSHSNSWSWTHEPIYIWINVTRGSFHAGLYGHTQFHIQKCKKNYSISRRNDYTTLPKLMCTHLDSRGNTSSSLCGMLNIVCIYVQIICVVQIWKQVYNTQMVVVSAPWLLAPVPCYSGNQRSDIIHDTLVRSHYTTSCQGYHAHLY